MKRVTVFLLFICGLFSCTDLGKNKFVHRQELEGLMKELGLHKSSIINGANIEIFFTPSSFLSSEESPGEFSEWYYFTVKISKNNNDLESWFYHETGNMESVVKFLTENLSKSVYFLTENGVKVYSLDYHFTRTYGVSPWSTFLFVFEKDEFVQGKNIEMHIRIPELLIDQRFNFDNQKILDASSIMTGS